MASSRRYPERPMVGVGGVIVNEQRQVLMIQRGSQPGRGRWSFPGGLVEVGEPLREACAREVLEETGLEVVLEDVVKVVEKVERDEQQRDQLTQVKDPLHPLRGGRRRRRQVAGSSLVLGVEGVEATAGEALESSRGLGPRRGRGAGAKSRVPRES